MHHPRHARRGADRTSAGSVAIGGGAGAACRWRGAPSGPRLRAPARRGRRRGAAGRWRHCRRVRDAPCSAGEASVRLTRRAWHVAECNPCAFVVLGAGAIGGAVGGRLFQAGHDVTLVARGEHGRALASGPRARGTRRVRHPAVPAVSTPSEVALGRRSGHRRPAGRQGPAHRPRPGPAATVAPPDHAGGLPAERRGERAPGAARLPLDLRGVRVVPGHAASSRGGPAAFGAGVGPPRRRAATRRASTTRPGPSPRPSRRRRSTPMARPDIMRWKYRKLLSNLANAVEALCGPEAALRPAGQGGRARRSCRARWRPGSRSPATRSTGRTTRLSRWPRRRRAAGRAGRAGRAWLRGHRVDRGRVPQRRDRAARGTPRRGHPGQCPAAAPGRRGRRGGDRSGAVDVDALSRQAGVDHGG